MEQYEAQLAENYLLVDRYVKYRLNGTPDAEDLVQEICLTACRKYDQLKDKSAFKNWILSIARNQCNDYFRKRLKIRTIPIEEVPESQLIYSRQGLTVQAVVRETMESLSRQDREILNLFFFEELPQAEIALQLGIPLGTVKSRLHHAKNRFRDRYPYPPQTKGETIMGKLPVYMPEYKIERSTMPPFGVKWEELMGWFLVPKLGEKLSWAMYDMPSRKRTDVFDMKVTGKAMVHGIEGVELTAREAHYSNREEVINRTFVAQLTDTHCRYLATMRNDGDVRNYITFLDGDAFLPNWGYGPDNCGNETNLAPKGDIRREGDVVSCADKEFLLDIVGRYTVTINGKVYDTVCVMDIESYNCGVVAEQFLDKNGRTILWRRFNKNDWAIDRFGGMLWSEKLPGNEQLSINGETYVHWYDCISDYIL